MSRSKRRILSCFIALNLFTVLWMNRPVPLIEGGDALLGRYLSPLSAHYVRLVGWYIHRYAHLTGLDNRWQMFGEQSRFNWWYVIKARYEDLEPRVLPLPFQSERSFVQHLFFDFKETKFHLNLYPRPEARKAYARYLCRQYPVYAGRSITSVIFELHWQMLRPREEASRVGWHLYPETHNRVVNRFKCY